MEMKALSTYFAAAAVLLGTLLIYGNALASLEVNPLKGPMELIADNFNKSCHNLNQSDTFLKYLQNEELLLGEVSSISLKKIIQAPVEVQKKSFREILYHAIDISYPAPDMANELLKEYFEDIFNTTGITTFLLVIFGSQKGTDKLFQSSMERACKNVSNSEGRCDILIPLIGCLEKSFAPQNVMNNFLPNIIAALPKCQITVPKLPGL